MAHQSPLVTDGRMGLGPSLGMSGLAKTKPPDSSRWKNPGMPFFIPDRVRRPRSSRGWRCFVHGPVFWLPGRPTLPCLPIPLGQWRYRLSSPVTAAGPRRIRTVFPEFRSGRNPPGRNSAHVPSNIRPPGGIVNGKRDPCRTAKPDLWLPAKPDLPALPLLCFLQGKEFRPPPTLRHSGPRRLYVGGAVILLQGRSFWFLRPRRLYVIPAPADFTSVAP